MRKRLTHEEMIKVCSSLNKLDEPYQPYPEAPSWERLAENDEYAYEYNSKTADSQIIDKKTNRQIWGYYEDFYTG